MVSIKFNLLRLKKKVLMFQKLEEEVLKNTKLLTIKKILDDKSVYYRIITENKLIEDAENICKNVLKQKYQCLIIKDNKQKKYLRCDFINIRTKLTKEESEFFQK